MLNYSVYNCARLRININLLDSFFPISWKTLKNINNFSYFVIFIALEKFSNTKFTIRSSKLQRSSGI